MTTTIPTLHLPDWATPTPPGYCHRCGHLPDGTYPHDIRSGGGCGWSRDHVRPIDPAATLAAAVRRIIYNGDDLSDVGPLVDDGTDISTQVAERALARIARSLRIASGGTE